MQAHERFETVPAADSRRPVILGQPTDYSITVKTEAGAAGEPNVECGMGSRVLAPQTKSA